jgi:hypothetical protein
MADKSTSQPVPEGTGEQPKQKSFFQQISGSIIQVVFFWLIMKMLTGGIKKRTTPLLHEH